MKKILLFLLMIPALSRAQIINLSNVVQPVGTSPILTLSATSISSFTATTGTASSPVTFTISGTNLTAGATVTSPGTWLELSLDNSTYASSVNISQSGGSLVSQPVTIFARVPASASAGAFSGNISCTSTGATTKTVAASASVSSSTPSISTNVNLLSNFTNTAGTPSTSKSFTVTGAALTTTGTVTPPGTWLELSLDNTTFATSLTLARTGTAFTGQPVSVFARVAAGATAGSYSGNITVASTGATTQNVAVTATVSSAGGSNDTLLVNFTAGSFPVLTGGWNNYTPANLSTAAPTTTSSAFNFKTGVSSGITFTLSGAIPPIGNVNSFFTPNNTNWGAGTTSGFNDTAFRDTYLFNDPGPDSLIINSLPVAANGYDIHIGSSRSTATSRNQNISCIGATTTSTTFNAQNNINNTINFIGITKDATNKITLVFTPNGQPGGGNDFQFITFIQIIKRN